MTNDKPLPCPGAQVAAASGGNEQLLYFTSHSLTRDDAWLFTISDRTGHPNVFATRLADGEARRITDNHEGHLRSYVYFDGQAHRGFGRASPSLDPERGRLYYLQGDEIRVADLAGNRRALATLPPGQVTAFTHVSADGRRLCIPTTDERALEYPPLKPGATHPGYDIDRRVQDEGLASYLRIYDTETGAELAVERVPSAWITHVQFNPDDPALVLYNHEWPCRDAGARRAWLWNGHTGQHLPLRPGTPERAKDDWICHEMWTPDGRGVIYHGTRRHDRLGLLGRWDRASGQTREIHFPAAYHAYGHFTMGPDGRTVSDGYYEPAEGPRPPADRPGAWLSVQTADWDAGTLHWTPLGLHGSSWATQDEHPHPVFDHRGGEVYFTADAQGRRRVYRIPVPSARPETADCRPPRGRALARGEPSP